MLYVLLLIILTFVITFLEGFFMQLSVFSVFILISILLWGRMRSIHYLTFISLLSIILDVVFNLGLGTYLLPVFVGVLLLSVLKRFVPSEGVVPTLVIYLVVYMVCYLLFEILQSLLLVYALSSISWLDALFMFIKSLLSSGVVVLVSVFGSGVRSKNFESIRLR